MNWTLIEPSMPDTAVGRLTGYAVHDALGMRLGYVTGWVTDPDGQVQLLKVAVTEWDGTSEFLIPVGAITLVSDTKSLIQLRDLTKQSIARLCYRFEGELPEPRLLVSLQRHFRAPRVSVRERLADALQGGDGPPWTLLSDMSAQTPRDERG